MENIVNVSNVPLKDTGETTTTTKGNAAATSAAAATQKSQSGCHDCKPAVQTCGCYIGVCDDHFDELHLIRSVVDILFDWVLTLQKRQDRAKLKAESQSRPWTPGNRERTNGR